MPTLQHEALKAIAGDQVGMFAFCEINGVYYHPMEPTYLTMGRIAQWALLMKNTEATKIPTKTPKPDIIIHGDVTIAAGTTVGWESGREEVPMSEGGQV
jgi:hypothetical protein